jgi:hypothetical protein
MSTEVWSAAVRSSAVKSRLQGWRPYFWIVLLLTASLSLIWSQAKLMNQDELFSYQTDSANSMRQVLWIQQNHPLSLEPPLNHVFSYEAMKLFGRNKFSLRLPSLIGYLLAITFTYLLVRNMAGAGIGLIAMVIPTLTGSFYFSTEGRPYGLLIGATAAVCFFWQAAASRLENRRLLLAGLFISLAVTVNSHFMGVLVVIAICGTEIVRTIERRKLDLPMLAAIALGGLSIVLLVPYLKGTLAYKAHYYSHGKFPITDLFRTYRALILGNYTILPAPVERALMIAAIAAAVLLLWGGIRIFRSDERVLSPSQWALILLITALPVIDFFLARVATNAFEARHVIGFIIGFSALVAIIFGCQIRSEKALRVVLVVMAICSVALNIGRTAITAGNARSVMAELRLPPALQRQIDASSDHNIYIQENKEWEVANQYEPDPELKKRLVLVYSENEELKWNRQDTTTLAALNTMQIASMPIASYDALEKQPGDHYFAIFDTTACWERKAFAQEAKQIEFVGDALGGKVYRVRFQ